MPYRIPKLNEIEALEPSNIVHAAVDYLPAGFPGSMTKALIAEEAKGCAVRAVIAITTRDLTAQLESAMARVLAGYELGEGDRADSDAPALWDVGLEMAMAAELADVKTSVGAHGYLALIGPNIRVDNPDILGRAAQGLAAVLTHKLCDVQPGDRGKLLSSVGVAKAELDQIAASTGPEIIAGRERDETWEMVQEVHYVGGPDTPAEAQHFEPAPAAAPAAGPIKKPGHMEITAGWKRWDLATSMDGPETAKRLNISRGTLDNWRKGKVKSVLDYNQVAVLLADIDARMVALTYARDIFNRLQMTTTA